MKKYFLSVACLCLCVGFVFTSCSKDDDGPGTSSVKDNKITATVSASNVDNVKALIDYYSGDVYEIANSSFSNGFTLTLPATVDAKYLDAMGSMPSGVSVSDKNAKGNSITVVGYNKSNVEVGTFWYVSTTSEADLMYVDRDVTITGSYTDEDGDKWVFNASLVKGWNYMYVTGSEKNDVLTLTVTTSDPGGLKWYFDADSDLKSSQSVSVSKSKFAGSKKLMFKGLK